MSWLKNHSFSLDTSKLFTVFWSSSKKKSYPKNFMRKCWWRWYFPALEKQIGSLPSLIGSAVYIYKGTGRVCFLCLHLQVGKRGWLCDYKITLLVCVYVCGGFMDLLAIIITQKLRGFAIPGFPYYNIPSFWLLLCN